jgi:hypothetical protein
MAYQFPSGSFVHSAFYASVFLQMTQHLFPDQRFPALSPDQRRIVGNETNLLLLHSRQAMDSRWFAEYFATPQGPEAPEAPEGTILGTKVPDAKAPGQYA